MDISVSDLIIAYRKAKIDAFYETGHLTSRSFADYEENLFINLEKLLKKINGEDKVWFGTEDFVGTHHFALKKVDFDKGKETKDEPFVFFSSSKKNWEDYGRAIPDFRIIGNHSVDFHILSSLWIEKVGLSLEEKISENSYGCRLKRVGQGFGRFIPSDIDEQLPHVSTFVTGHFRPYLADYQNWQYKGIESIKRALLEKKKVVAVTADLKKYYHRIDCSFIQDPAFLKFISHNEYNPDQHRINELLVYAISSWSRNVYNDENVPKEFKYKEHAGVPMGLGASKIIANLLLTYLDTEIESEIKPIYYGRYVDDLFIVLEDGSSIDSPEKFWDFLMKRIENLKKPENAKNESDSEEDKEYNPEGNILKVPFSRKSLLEFGRGKEKYFFLEGLSGDSFLDTLKESMDENSSEWKLPPNTNDDLESYSEEIAKASSTHGEPANGLRKSDGVSIQRLKLILYLTRFEKVADLLPKNKWTKTLDKFFALAIEYTIRPNTIAVFSKYFPRVMALAVKTENFAVANEIINQVKYSFKNLISLSSERNAEKDLDRPSLLERCLKNALAYQIELIKEGVYSIINPFTSDHDKNDEYKKLLFELNMNSEYATDIAFKLFNSDLHKIPFKDIFINPLEDKEWYSSLKNIKFDNDIYLRLEGLPNYHEFSIFSDFIKETVLPAKNIDFRPFGFYFYTRPFNTLELTIIFPSWYNDPEKLELFCKLFNREWFKPGFPPEKDNPTKLHKIISIKSPENSLDRVIAFTSLETKDISWAAVVREDGKEPDTNREQRILDLVRDIIKCTPRCTANGMGGISYVLFPELAMPRKMLIYVAGLLLRVRISLIAGVEYQHYSSTNVTLPNNFKGFVSNQLIYILCVKSLSTIQQIAIIQEKAIPAQKEEANLFSVGGKILQAQDETKFIINHGGFWFSGLICNDLLNIDNRSALRGFVDALIVIEWNKDMDHYDSLVAATANDLHTFILQVNNRLYGDTRLRGPYKESYDRDKVRVRGGELDYFVVATLEVEKLRKFQRNHRSPSTPFKPVPTGFVMSKKRRKK